MKYSYILDPVICVEPRLSQMLIYSNMRNLPYFPYKFNFIFGVHLDCLNMSLYFRSLFIYIMIIFKKRGFQKSYAQQGLRYSS